MPGYDTYYKSFSSKKAAIKKATELRAKKHCHTHVIQIPNKNYEILMY